MNYDFQKIEKHWQKIWQKEKVYEPDFKGAPFSAKASEGRAKKPFYNLMMFPYPSAEGLHVGNMYAFTGSDIYGRFKRMQGYDVFEPIGLDGFGIHSENYALKIGAHPMKQAKISEKRFYEQLAMIGNGFAWNERLETYDPNYYKWTQWIFVQLFKNGLAYRKKQAVNWCPSCKTVLADEQVIAGRCERCSTKVIKKELEQWFFRITKYAEKLLKNLKNLPDRQAGIDWSEKVKIAQRNWIGKSEGAEIEFPVKTDFNYVLLHGFTGTPNGIFFPWLKRELQKRELKYSAPQLPNTKNPVESEQVGYVLKHCKFGNRTILFGHSLGAVVAMKVAEKLRGKITGLVLAGGFLNPNFRDHSRPFDKTFGWKFDFQKIKRNVGFVKILSDKNDYAIPLEQGRLLRKKLSGLVIEAEGQKPHFTDKVEPEILESLTPSIKVFTTRPDTLFGATYMVLAPEHPLVASLLAADSRGLYADLRGKLENRGEVKKYVDRARKKSEEERIAEGRDKTGVELKGVKAINPATKEEIPVWVADYVLGDVGTGAIMAVPAHDERDFEFAEKYDLLIKQVIEPFYVQTTEPGVYRDGEPIVPREGVIVIVKHWSEDKYIGLRWKKVAWGTFITGGVEKGQTPEEAAAAEIREETGYLHPKFVRELGMTHGLFYHVPKKENRLVHGHILYFELEDDAKEKISKVEEAIHEVKWLTLEELRQFLTPATHTYALSLLDGRFTTFTGKGVLMNSGKFSGRDSEKAKWEITKFVGGQRKVQYRLRDWLISRQRYWGPPIPVIFCNNCKKLLKSSKFKVPRLRRGFGGQESSKFSKGELENPGWIAAPEDKLPVKLPFVKNFQPKGTGKAPLATVKSFYETKCPKCGGKARRETDVSDTFLDSAWYYIGYLLLAGNSKFEFQNSRFRALVRRWLPVDMYIGGAEHSVLHLLYSRFLAMVFKNFKLVGFEEPFTKFRAHGLLIKEGGKMSKSKGNIVNPDEYIKKFGADTFRMYLMFLAPFEQGGDFRDAGILGIKRFLQRVWNLGQMVSGTGRPKNSQPEILRALNKTIRKVTEDVENLRYNTAISALMILLNELEKNAANVSILTWGDFLKLLAPFAPHLSEELWQPIAKRKAPIAKRRFASIHLEKWPKYDERLVAEKTFTFIIQVNGRVRDSFPATAGISEKEAKETALQSEKIRKYLAGKKPLKTIYVPRRLINFVIEE